MSPPGNSPSHFLSLRKKRHLGPQLLFVRVTGLPLPSPVPEMLPRWLWTSLPTSCSLELPFLETPATSWDHPCPIPLLLLRCFFSAPFIIINFKTWSFKCALCIINRLNQHYTYLGGWEHWERPIAGPGFVRWLSEKPGSQLSHWDELGCVSSRHSLSILRAGAAHCLQWTSLGKSKPAGRGKTAVWGRGLGLKAYTCERLFGWVLIWNVHFQMPASGGPKRLQVFSLWQVAQLHPRKHKTPLAFLELSS